MKNKFVLFMVAILATLSIGCSGGGSDPEPPADPYLTLSKTNINLSVPDSSEQSIEISSSDSWKAVFEGNSGSWITLTPSSGSSGKVTVKVVVSENSGTETRTGSVKFSNSSKQQTLQITQVGQTPTTPTLEINPTQKSVSSEAGVFSVTVTANSSWSISSSPSWITLDSTSGDGNATVDVSYEANSSETERSATLTFTSGDLERSLVVTQEGKEQASITLVSSSANVTATAGETSMQIQANVAWSISQKPEWVTLSASSGNGDATVTLNYTANSGVTARSGSIVVEGEGQSATFTLTQQGSSENISIDMLSNTVTPASGSFTINLTSNTSWAAIETLDWVSLSPASGSGSSAVVVSYTENSLTQSRSGEFTFVTDGGESVKFTLTQSAAAPKFDIVGSASIAFGQAASVAEISFKSNISWSVSSSQDWLTINKASGSGDGSITVSAPSNNTQTVRSAVVTFVAGDITKTVTVTQATTQLPDFNVDDL